MEFTPVDFKEGEDWSYSWNTGGQTVTRLVKIKSTPKVRVIHIEEKFKDQESVLDINKFTWKKIETGGGKYSRSKRNKRTKRRRR
jgi:hypothetical protein